MTLITDQQIAILREKLGVPSDFIERDVDDRRGYLDTEVGTTLTLPDRNIVLDPHSPDRTWCEYQLVITMDRGNRPLCRVSIQFANFSIDGSAESSYALAVDGLRLTEPSN